MDMHDLIWQSMRRLQEHEYVDGAQMVPAWLESHDDIALACEVAERMEQLRLAGDELEFEFGA